MARTYSHAVNQDNKYWAKRGTHLVDNDAIRSRMWLRKVSITMLAAAVGVTENTIRNKLACGSWTLEEAYRISMYLGLDVMQTFFAHPESVVPYMPEAPVVSEEETAS